jgi:Uri superfamily endonuclease
MTGRVRSRRPGAYVLVIDLPKDAVLEVGRLGRSEFPAGVYGYVGSAMGGLEGRLGRHLDPERATHWHIDRLTRAGEVRGAFVIPSARRQECRIASTLAKLPGSGPFCRGFGCSDCGCDTHLFTLEEGAVEALGVLYGPIVPAAALIRAPRRR